MVLDMRGLRHALVSNPLFSAPSNGSMAPPAADASSLTSTPLHAAGAAGDNGFSAAGDKA